MDASESGAPGASLQREYERRLAAHETRVAERKVRVMTAHPWIGRWLIGSTEAAHTTTAFAKGAAGEREAAQILTAKLGDSVLFLFNRRVGTGTARGDIDIIAIAASGVFVLDPKAYRNKKVRANRRRDAFVINGRARPTLSDAMRRHIDAVAIAVSEGPIPAVAVSAAYCFLGSEMPWGRLVVDDVVATTPRGVVKMLKKPGPLSADDRALLHAYLTEQFPPA